MSRIVYVNGEYLAEEDAKISVFDRGFLFADGVYEVSSVIEGHLLENEGHMRRLRRSLSELDMASPATDSEIEAIQMELISRNGLKEGGVYLQVTRGAADRDFAYPKDATPSLVMFTQEKNLMNSPVADKGISVITLPELRWARRDIKTVGLLAPCMAKQAALNAGAQDAWFVEDGYITEGSSNNAYIVTEDDVIVTRHIGNEILSGITRASVLELSRRHGYVIEERLFTVEEALKAKEAFITSATTFVWPVVSIDGNQLGDGKPGDVAKKLRAIYIEQALESIQG